MEIKIKLANIENVKNVQRLSQELIELEDKICKEKYTISLDWSLSEHGKEYFENHIKNKHIYLAEYDKKIVGYICFYILEQEKYETVKQMKVENLIIQKDYRRLGIGKALMNKAFEICKENGVNCITLTSISDNIDARLFYNSLGFKSYNTEYQLSKDENE
ncbi:MAG: GNAT family N-acetyltransferase [Clostridia bacterium]|nr:GNAT family N-acetyltransferase [Clostridia bacterium]